MSDQFFSGNQPVFDEPPAEVGPDGQPTSANWPGPNVVPPTNPDQPVNPGFVGNQPNSIYPPSEVDVDHGQPPSANWPQPPDYPPEPPPENPG